MFSSNTVDKIVAKLTATVSDLRTLQANKDAEANDLSSKLGETMQERDRAERIANKLEELLK